MWKIERFFYDQPQMFLEPSGISDSGAFSQSTFSELQSEEDKGNYQFVVVVVASLNYTYSCISPWRSCMTLWWLACVASVSARFRSKERATRVKERAKKWLSFHFSRGQNRSFFAPKPNGNACYAGYLMIIHAACLYAGTEKPGKWNIN